MTEHPAPFSHCHACGARYGACPPPPMPRECGECGFTKWFNPTPISVLLQPVFWVAGSQVQWGLLAAQRGIAPKRGEFGLIGGFVEIGDSSYEDAAHREDREEIEFAPGHGHDPGPPRLWYSAPGDPGQMIAFSIACWGMPRELLQYHLPNSETLALKVLEEPETLCFSSHTEAARRWFGLADRALPVQAHLS